MIYKATEMVNFAQCDIMMLGGFVAYTAVAHFGLNYWLGGLIAMLVAGYIAWKYIERHRFYRELRIARVAPEELRGMLDDGEAITVLDLRNAREWSGEDAFKLPGAVHMSFEELERRMDEIPLDRDVILYCT